MVEKYVWEVCTGFSCLKQGEAAGSSKKRNEILIPKHRYTEGFSCD
jgi:NADH:ubiquinone oxidoreductase subunit E